MSPGKAAGLHASPSSVESETPSDEASPPKVDMSSASPVSAKSEEGGEDADFSGSWVTFVNPSTGRTLRLPAHTENTDRWRGPGAWTSDDDELDDEARQIIAGIGRQPCAKERRRWRREDSEVPCLRSPATTSVPHARPSSAAVPASTDLHQHELFGSLTQTSPACPHLATLIPSGREDLLPAFPSEPSPPPRLTYRGASPAGLQRPRVPRHARARQVLRVCVIILLAACIVCTYILGGFGPATEATHLTTFPERMVARVWTLLARDGRAQGSHSHLPE